MCENNGNIGGTEEFVVGDGAVPVPVPSDLKLEGGSSPAFGCFLSEAGGGVDSRVSPLSEPTREGSRGRGYFKS